jgi:hypothetical protein
MSKSVFIVFFFSTVVFGNTHLTHLWMGNRASTTMDRMSMFSAGIEQTASLTGKTDTVPNSSAAGKKKNDTFSKLMAGVVNDTTILYDTYVDVDAVRDTVSVATVKKSIVKPDSTVTALAVKKPQKDTTQKKAVAVQVTEKKKPEVQNPAQKATVEKIGELSNDSVLQMAYVTTSVSGKRDTIFLSIPFETKVAVAAVVADTPVKKPIVTTAKSEPVKEQLKDTVNAGLKQAVQTTQTAVIPPVKDSVKHVAVVEKKPEEKTVSLPPSSTAMNSNCRNSASDYDVDKLRVKMLAVDNDDDKLLVARKLFRIKCFTTKQIKALSEVFPTDEGRYKLFDTAYPFASDFANYPQLADLLTSPYFINRFKAMLRP